MKLVKTILLSTICIASLVSCNQTRDENTIVVDNYEGKTR